MGWQADATGQVNTATPIKPIKIEVSSTMPPNVSTFIELKGNLNAAAALAQISGTSSVTVYDAQGYDHRVFTTYTKTADNTWIAETHVEGAVAGSVKNNIKQITFDEYGNLLSVKDCIPGVHGEIENGLIKNVFDAPIMLDSNSPAGYSKEVDFSIVDKDKNNIIRNFTLKAIHNGGNVWDLEIYEEGNPTPVGIGGCAVLRHYHTMPQLTLSDGTVLDFEISTLAQPIDPVNDNPILGSFDYPSIYISPLGEDFGVITPKNVVVDSNNPLIFTPEHDVAGPMSVQMNFDGMTQYASEFNIAVPYQGGYASGELLDKVIDASGMIVGVYSNGQRLNLAQLALAIFNNQQGLERSGSTLFSVSNNSGDPNIGAPGTGGRGTLQAGALEMSNVDLAEEFTNMIVTQRGYQSNSRIITTSDELLQELLNLKR